MFGAGTLATPFAAEIAAFKKANPGVTVHSQFGASGDMVKAVTQLHQPDDVLGVADYSLIPKLMFPASATWYLGFVSNAITFAYTSHSKGASGLTAANWYKVLAGPGVHIGRSNPAADPSGYQILQMLQLANGYYNQPDLSASVLKNSPDSSVAETETSLLAALQSGQIDYLALYTSTAQEEHLKYIALPTQINLSDPAMAAEYGKVSINAGSLGTLTAKPIIYGLTIPASAPRRGAGREVHQLRARLAGPGDHAQQRVRRHLPGTGEPAGQGPRIGQAADHPVAVHRRVRPATRPPGVTMTT